MKLFIIACTCLYTATAEKVDFIQQPTTDKQCYYEGDDGTLTLSYHVTGTTPLDFYKVALTTNPDGTWGFKSNGTELKFYDTLDRDTKHARFRVTMSFVNRTAEYRLHVSCLELHDETNPLYASIIESHSGKVMITSPVGARFYVNGTCPQRPQPTSSSVTNKGKGDSNQDHTSDPTEPSTTTAPPNIDTTSTGCIPAKPTIQVFCTSFYILLAIHLCCFTLIFILYWFCIRRNPSQNSLSTVSGTPMSPRVRNGNLTM